MENGQHQGPSRIANGAARTGLTRVELLVVILATVAIVVFALVMRHRSRRTRELARRVKCQANLKYIGEALSIYVKDPLNRGEWPWVYGNIGEHRTGTNYGVEPAYPQRGPRVDRSVTALPFLLVHTKLAEPGQFVCVSDEDAVVQTNVNPARQWDFRAARHVSYSYAAPIGGHSGISADLEDPASVAVMADKSPAADGMPLSPWTDNMTASQRRASMSRNHRGEAINVLWADSHATTEIRADVGIDRDCIYTAGGAAGPSRSATSTRLSDHVNSRDSFLVGPYGRR